MRLENKKKNGTNKKVPPDPLFDDTKAGREH